MTIYRLKSDLVRTFGIFPFFVFYVVRTGNKYLLKKILQWSTGNVSVTKRPPAALKIIPFFNQSAINSSFLGSQRPSTVRQYRGCCVDVTLTTRINYTCKDLKISLRDAFEVYFNYLINLRCFTEKKDTQQFHNYIFYIIYKNVECFDQKWRQRKRLDF